MGSSNTSNVTFPFGTITIDPVAREITGSNPERQDFIISPTSTPAKGFKGYFCARFDKSFTSWGIANNGTLRNGLTHGNGSMLSGYAIFGAHTKTVNVRVGVSFISVNQARRNLDKEIADGTSLEDTAKTTRTQWAEKLDRIRIEGASEEEKQVFYTAFFHALQVNCLVSEPFNVPNLTSRQYPYEQDEDGRYYSGYDDSVHVGQSYTGYSIWVS